MAGIIFNVEKELLVIEANRRIGAVKADYNLTPEQYAGKISGAIRWYRGALLLLATRVVLDGMDVSRDYIRKWQLEHFGRCTASKDLKHFAVTSRVGGGRAKNNIHDAFAEQIKIMCQVSADEVGDIADKFNQQVIIHEPPPLNKLRRI